MPFLYFAYIKISREILAGTSEIRYTHESIRVGIRYLFSFKLVLEMHFKNSNEENKKQITIKRVISLYVIEISLDIHKF
jgi:hypothetical protein